MGSDRRRLKRAIRTNPYGTAAVVVSFAVGLLVFGVAQQLFPYHSVNHDEGVYLQQAAMLLEGQLVLTPGNDALREAVHPWFFVAGDRGLYPKYAPVPAALFGVGKLLGSYRLALAGIAASNVGLGYLLAAATFDRRTGLLAAILMAASPLFVINSAVYLPYAPTTALNLLFAVAYVRSVRQGDRRAAALAGIAIGLAFFARPYTAVLFAVPFVIHALWWLTRNRTASPAGLIRTSVTAGFGLAFVAVALAYNAMLTGSALRFPYEAFAPRDGIGFGRRALLGYEVNYTLELALRATAEVLWSFTSRWFALGLIGTTAAVVGILAFGRAVRRDGFSPEQPLGPRRLQLVLVGVVVSVILGNVAFWGNLNILGRLADPTDGFIGVLGPFYHFDLLLPVASFAAHGIVRGSQRGLDLVIASFPVRSVRLASVLLLAVTLPVIGAAEVAVLDEPVDRNVAHTERLANAYAPFESTDTENAVVFLPPTYGEWRNHPFQWLRNDPDFEGPTVYVLARNPTADFVVIDAYPDRALFRYRYHGVWSDDPPSPVIPILEPIDRVSGDAVSARTTVSVPDRIVGLRVAATDGTTVNRYEYHGELPSTLALDWTITSAGIDISHPNLSASGEVEPFRLDHPDELVLTVTITEPGGSTLTYREAILVRPTDSGVEVLWPPAASACPLVSECGLRGTYLPDRPDTRPAGITMNTTLQGVKDEEAASADSPANRVALKHGRPLVEVTTGAPDRRPAPGRITDGEI